jgi:hypothetical protein
MLRCRLNRLESPPRNRIRLAIGISLGDEQQQAAFSSATSLLCRFVVAARC